MTTKKLLTTFAIVAVILSLLLVATAAASEGRRAGGRDPTFAERFKAITGENSYSAALRIGLGSTEYVSNGQHFVIEQSVFKNIDKILIIDYLNNPGGLGISLRTGYTRFKITGGDEAGKQWDWGFSDSTDPSWTYSYGIWGPVGGFPASDLCTDCIVEIHTHFDVGIDTETETITIGNPSTPSPTPTGLICTPGERACAGAMMNEVWECNAAGNGWQKIQTCAYGCSNGVCLNAPTAAPTPDIPGYDATIAITGLLAIAVILLKRRA